MFSGIIKWVGKIESIEEKGTTKRFTISSSISNALQIDQSIAHDGVCLTIVHSEDSMHQVEVVNETLAKSTLSNAKFGQIINLEKSISAATLLDGHLVQGHVDTTLTCINIRDLKGSWKFSFDLPVAYAGLIIPQGSICINGVSLTVSDVTSDSFSLAIIPYTFENTNFKFLKEGEIVNAEFDLIGKYIVRQFELRFISE
ncbi:MAG TPA: riboflavin synthase [Saprospiraceae bacterium]|nr:riboflavin synthase [Saprospiraceae bacterium]